MHQTKAYLNEVFHATLSGIMVIDAEERTIRDVNSAACEAIGLSRKAIVGKTCHSFVCPAEQGNCPIADLGQVLDRSERILLTGNGVARDIPKTVKPVILDHRLYYIESFVDISIRKAVEKEREGLIAELTRALDTIKTLRGIVPICSHCKKIRDDRGYWNKLEAYIEKHSDAAFSHGMCPECADLMYGHEEWYIEMKKKNGR